MDKRFGYFMFGGVVIGALLGLMWSGTGNVLARLGIGALAGAFIGGFLAAAAIEQQQQKEHKENP